MTKPRTMKLTSPADLLAAVPCLLGFHPEDSLVLVTVGEAGRAFHARVDLPRGPDDIAALADYLSSVVERNGVRRCALVAYSDDHRAALAVTDSLTDRLLGIAEVTLVIRAHGGRWYPLSDCGQGHCPAEGTAYDVSAHRFTAEAVLDGHVTLGSRQELADSLIGTDPDAVEAVREAADRALTRMRGAVRDPFGPPAPRTARAHLVQEGQWVAERVRRFLADRGTLSAEDAGRLVAALTVVDIRDVAWAEMERGNASRHVDLWRDLVRRTPPELRAAPAALLGFAAWLAGEGALAWCDAEPDYSLAGLLTHALAAAVPPSSWEPIAKKDLALFAS
jgi:hypothetical protein